MNPTGIDWVVNPDGSRGFTLNCFVGCSHNGCAVWPDCYAAKSAKRKKWVCRKCYTFEPHIHGSRIVELFKLSMRKKPVGVFLDSMSDFLDIGFTDDEIRDLLRLIARSPQHRFYLLTKNAQRIPRFTYPSNLWQGGV